jgi:hypothetical protein
MNLFGPANYFLPHPRLLNNSPKGLSPMDDRVIRSFSATGYCIPLELKHLKGQSCKDPGLDKNQYSHILKFWYEFSSVCLSTITIIFLNIEKLI